MSLLNNIILRLKKNSETTKFAEKYFGFKYTLPQKILLSGYSLFIGSSICKYSEMRWKYGKR